MKIQSLSSYGHAALNDALELAARLVDGRQPLTPIQVQALYDTLLSTDVKHDQGVIALGLAFGQLVIDASNFEWVRVSSEYGEETCISPVGAEIICAPISMIQKRLDKDEPENIIELRDETIRVLNAHLESGEYRRR